MIEADVAMHLKKTYQRITQMMRQKIDEYGLSFRLLHIVMLIDKNPDMNQKELAEQMRLSEGAVSGSIKNLIKLDMLKQIPLEKDMRYNRLVITEHGRIIINDYKEHVYTRYKDLFSGFTQDELEVFDNLLAKINKNLDQIGNKVDK